MLVRIAILFQIFICVAPDVLTGSMQEFQLPQQITERIDMIQALCQPEKIQVVHGSQEEYKTLLQELIHNGTLLPLNQKKMPGCYLARSSPLDVARVEDKTYICTPLREHAGITNNWVSPVVMHASLQGKFSGCMKGRTMYVVPICMGPISSPYARFGIHITDSPYIVASLRAMTRMGDRVVEEIQKRNLGEDELTICVHSVGKPINSQEDIVAWPCNPKELVIAHFPEENEVWSFGSNYGGNALLNKKCLALRLASVQAKKEGWLAEHMLILSIKNPEGKKKYILAAFPSACGKTNLAMLNSHLPGWQVKVVGDDIAWLHWDSDGIMRAINPEFGFFGVAPGTSETSNPVALSTISSDTIYTNVALLPDGTVWWEGKTKTPPPSAIDWQGNFWTPSSKTPAAHPNARFCTQLQNCPSLDQEWDNGIGVPVDAIIFGGRRATTIPLVREAGSWNQGVLFGASISSETTAAATGTVGTLRHDPFAMLPFCGYNMGTYFQHWLDFGCNTQAKKAPRIYMVNWFRKNKQGSFIWPGFHNNIHVLKWIFERCENQVGATNTPIGFIPYRTSIDWSTIEGIEGDPKELLKFDKEEWKEEVKELSTYFAKFAEDFPSCLWNELENVTQHL